MRGARSPILAIALTVASAASAWGQSGAQPHIQKLPPRGLPTKGLVDHGVYKNSSIGLEFTPASNLHLEEPELKGTPGSVPLLITIQAVDDSGLIDRLFSVRSLTIFYADVLAYYPEEQRNADRYLRKVVRTNASYGFQRVDGATSAEVNGISFARADFAKGGVHETVLVVVHDEYAFVFIFTGPSVEAANNLIALTKIRLTD